MSEDDSKPEPKKQGFWLGVAITGGAVALGVVHVIWPHLKIDSVTVVMVVIALVPWIGGIVQNIELPGGFKVGLREAQQAAAKAQTQADQAASTATAALSAATTRTGQSVTELANEYVRIRREVPSGPQRTSALDRLAGQLAVATSEDPSFDFNAEIKSAHPGLRLAALTYAYARPSAEMMEELVGVAQAPDSSFEQYWAIRALLEVTSINSNISQEILDGLQQLYERLDPHTSRAAVMEQLLHAR